MKALLSNYHQSPRKVRLVADVVRGKSIADAKSALAFLPQKSSPDLVKLIDSAVANARVAGKDVESLFIKAIAVNKGLVMRRVRPMARGRAASFRRTLSIISLELGENASIKAKSATKSAKKTKSIAKPSAKKVTKKENKDK